jgi:hypothetical protein
MVAFRNRSKGTELARQVAVADTTWKRLVGLLDRSALGPDEGLWIYPCSAVHTWGMRFPIDAVFLEKLTPLPEADARGRRCRVRRIYHRLAPWRLTGLVWKAESVLELAAGTAREKGIEAGDELEIRP